MWDLSLSSQILWFLNRLNQAIRHIKIPCFHWLCFTYEKCNTNYGMSAVQICLGKTGVSIDFKIKHYILILVIRLIPICMVIDNRYLPVQDPELHQSWWFCHRRIGPQILNNQQSYLIPLMFVLQANVIMQKTFMRRLE